MSTFQKILTVLSLVVTGTAQAGNPPGPASDELFGSTFEWMGSMRNFPRSYGFVVPSDGLPVMLQDDLDALYLAKCQRLDCATGVTRQFVARVDNRKRVALTLGSDGIPDLAYWDMDVGALRLASCTDVNCTDLTRETLFIGEVSEMAVAAGADGFPMIAFFEDVRFTKDLFFIKCKDLTCEDFEPPVVLDDASFGARITVGVGDDGLPAVAYSRVEFFGGNNFDRALRVTTCDADDCSGEIRRETVDYGILFEELGSGTLPTTLTMLLPPGRPPVLFGVLPLAANQNTRIVAIACNTDACDDAEDPEILGVGNYSLDLSASLSADGLPMVLGDINGLEFIQCQTVDCAGARTNRILNHPKFDASTLSAVLRIAADGNPIASIRGAGDAAGVVYCRDPECEEFAVR